jgi:hypothetical protein
VDSHGFAVESSSSAKTHRLTPRKAPKHDEKLKRMKNMGLSQSAHSKSSGGVDSHGFAVESSSSAKTHRLSPRKSPRKAPKHAEKLKLMTNMGLSRSAHSKSSGGADSHGHQLTPRKSPKHDEKLKRMTNMVQTLAEELKKRDRHVEKLQGNAEKLNDVSLQLENAQKRLVDAAVENQSLSRRVKSLQSTTEDRTSSRKAKVESTPCSHISGEKRIDVKLQSYFLLKGTRSKSMRNLQSPITLQAAVSETSRIRIAESESTTCAHSSSSEKRIEVTELSPNRRLQSYFHLIKADERAMMAFAKSPVE